MRNNHSNQPPFWLSRFWLLHLALPLVLALLLVLIYPRTGWDAFWINSYYDTHALVFPLKNDWFLENIMHKSLKYLMVGVSLMTLLLWILGIKSLPSGKLGIKNSWVQTYHRPFIWVFVAMVISTTIISILKHLSDHACPWSLLAYGGTQPLIPLFGSLPQGAVPGHCFPGGHASGGFALMAFYFAFRDTLPKLAKLGLVLGLVFGFVMGWAQMMRGAHFMSHNLWTAWIVWMILLVLYLIWPPETAR